MHLEAIEKYTRVEIVPLIHRLHFLSILLLIASFDCANFDLIQIIQIIHPFLD
jgi:hypothetical protein